ncbi:MAG: threonine synthase, partial [Bacteroidota bacterium]
LNLYGHVNGLDPQAPETHAGMREMITGYAYDDATTEAAVREVKDRFGYVIDPHGAVGYLALTEWQKTHPNTRGVILETAHPSKFKPDVERILGHTIVVPQRLAELEDREKVAAQMGTDYAPVRKWLRERYI